MNKPFLKHQDVQLVLAALRLPLIVLDAGGNPALSPHHSHSGNEVLDLSDLSMETSDTDIDQIVIIDDSDVPNQNESAQCTQQQNQQHQGDGQLVLAESHGGSVVPYRSPVSRNPGPKQLSKLTREDLAKMEPHQFVRIGAQLVRCLQQQMDRNANLNRKAKNMKRMCDRKDKAVIKKQKQLVSERSSIGPLHLVTSGKTGRRLTAQSGFALGIRRNYSNIACNCLGATILMDISGQRVARHEVKTAAGILASCRDANMSFLKAAQSVTQRFLEISDCDMDGSGLDTAIGMSLASSQSPWTLYVLSWRSDATNSCIWKREKLHVVDTTCAWADSNAGVLNFNEDGIFSVKRCLYFGCMNLAVSISNFNNLNLKFE